jgi:hypothetical protein
MADDEITEKTTRKDDITQRMSFDDALHKPIKGVRVGFDIKWHEDPDGTGLVAYRDHPTGSYWEVTKQGQLIIRDKKKKAIARYRQFVWREVHKG